LIQLLTDQRASHGTRGRSQRGTPGSTFATANGSANCRTGQRSKAGPSQRARLRIGFTSTQQQTRHQ
jgi:hypothetical protein